MEIKNLKRLDKNGIIAVFDVKFNDELIINGFKLASKKDGGEFVAMRSIKNYKDEWESIGWIGKATQDKIRDLVKGSL